jgi:hypothetical protein
MGKKQPWKMREEEKVMKISLVLALMLASGIIFFPMAGDAQMRQGMMGGGMSGGMTGPGQMEQNGPDGKYTRSSPYRVGEFGRLSIGGR